MKKTNRLHGMKACILGTVMALSVLSFSSTSFAKETTKEVECEEHRVTNALDAASCITDNWQDDYFEKITVEKNSNDIDIDGKSESFKDTFSANQQEMKKAVSSEKNLEDFLEKQEESGGKIYNVEKEKSGTFTVTAPYQTKRIVIENTKVSDNFGAKEKYIYSQGKKTILLYETEEDTRQAFDKIQKIYKKNCYVDEIITPGNTLQGLSVCYSWGGETMGMTSLRNNPKVQAKDMVTVAVLDSGIDVSSPVFNGTLFHPDYYNFVEGTKDVFDGYGHGTHVAGVIANLTPDNVRLLVLKVLGNDGYGSNLAISLAMDLAISKNVDVINLSAGFMTKAAKNYNFLDNAINTAYKKGIPVCVAAGNDEYGMFENKVENCYPANNSQAITVSAIGNDMKIGWYSCYGSKVDFTAPGTDIRSSWTGGRIKSSTGTSMACPHISAALAYVKLLNRKLSVEGCCLELRKYCVDLGAKGKDDIYGYGYPKIDKLFDIGETYSEWNVSKMLATPTLKSCINVKKGVKLSWNRVANASGYYVYRRKNGNVFTKIATVSVNTRSYTDKGVAEGDYNGYYLIAYTGKNGYVSQSAKSKVSQIVVLSPLSIGNVKALKKKKVQLIRKSGKYFFGEKIQVQFSTSKKFKSASTKTFQAGYTSYRFQTKKKGYHYIRARRVLTVEGKKYTSTWSNVKKLKVK